MLLESNTTQDAKKGNKSPYANIKEGVEKPAEDFSLMNKSIATNANDNQN